MSQHHHDHGHAHGLSFGHHHHHPAPADAGRAFALAIGLNAAFVAIEFIYGFIANSTALMADAGHNLSDVLGLVLAWGAAMLTKSAPTRRFTYGLRGSSILAALFNALLLMVACGAIAWEAVLRFAHPEPVAGTTVSIVAGIGVLINGFSAWLFMSGSKDDINVRGAYLHMAADAAHVRGRHLVADEGIGADGAGRRTGRGRCQQGQCLPGGAAGRERGARRSHLGDEHHRERADGAPGDAGRVSGRRHDRRDRRTPA
jgi:Co/Zn/Cd efflux system component